MIRDRASAASVASAGRWVVVGLGLAAILASAAPAQQPAAPHWPTLGEQLQGVIPGSALEKLVRDNQDFGLLDADEANEVDEIPAFLRVLWRKAHPGGGHAAPGKAPAYPLVLEDAWGWMLSHQDLQPSLPTPGTAPRAAAVNPGSEQRISGASTFPRSESDIRIDPFDPQKIAAACNTINDGRQAMLYSTNGGASWGQTSLPVQTQLGDVRQADPTADWTSDGTAWTTTLGINSTSTAVLVEGFKSFDHGATWIFDGLISGGQTTDDKEMLWIDHSTNPSDPFRNSLYVIWSVYVDQFTTQIYANHRSGPAGSWGTPLRLSGAETSAVGTGSDIKTNGYGDVFAFWHDAGTLNIYWAKSTNGGQSYGTPAVLKRTIGQQQIGIPAANKRTPLIYISAAAYRTAAKNLVYASWMDLTGEPGCDDSFLAPRSNVSSTCKSRIWFIRSQDGGVTWSPPSMLNNQPSLNDQFAQHLVVDEATGELAIIYYDTVGDPGRLKADVWFQASFDDGVTWSAPLKVTSAPTDETSSGADPFNQYGDYNGLAGYGGIFLPAWTDRRGNTGSSREEIWTAVLACSNPLAPGCGPEATFLSVNGSDSNNCGQGTPCRTFAGALARTPSGGRVEVLDSGDFGAATITRSVTLMAANGVLGGIQLGAGTAITVNAGASDKVVLRGLTLDGLGTAANGISFVAGGSLYVEKCTIDDFGGYGIDFAPASGSGKLFVTDSIVRNNGAGATGGGLHLIATTAPGFVAAVDGLRSENNVFGIKAETQGVITVRGSLAANNGFSGFSAVTPAGSGSVRMVIEDSVSTHNGTNGITAGNLATVTLSNVVVTDNQTGLGAGGAILSFGNNRVWGNVTDGAPTQTIASQ